MLVDKQDLIEVVIAPRADTDIRTIQKWLGTHGFIVAVGHAGLIVLGPRELFESVFHITIDPEKLPQTVPPIRELPIEPFEIPRPRHYT